MEELRRIRRESSSSLAPILSAKSVDDLLDLFMSTENGSEESTEALDEIIRRAVLYTEAREAGAKYVESVNKQYKDKGYTGKLQFQVLDPSSKGH